MFSSQNKKYLSDAMLMRSIGLIQYEYYYTDLLFICVVVAVHMAYFICLDRSLKYKHCFVFMIYMEKKDKFCVY